MILTHLVFFNFLGGAGDSGDVFVSSAAYGRIHQGVGVFFHYGPWYGY
jgi:hypothetical protein